MKPLKGAAVDVIDEVPSLVCNEEKESCFIDEKLGAGGSIVLKSGPFSDGFPFEGPLLLLLLLRLRVWEDLGIGSLGKDKSRRRLGSISEAFGSKEEDEEDMDKEESDEDEESLEGEAGIVVSADVDDFIGGISDLLDPLKFITFDDDAS